MYANAVRSDLNVCWFQPARFLHLRVRFVRAEQHDVSFVIAMTRAPDEHDRVELITHPLSTERVRIGQRTITSRSYAPSISRSMESSPSLCNCRILNKNPDSWRYLLLGSLRPPWRSLAGWRACPLTASVALQALRPGQVDMAGVRAYLDSLGKPLTADAERILDNIEQMQMVSDSNDDNNWNNGK